MSRTAVEFKKPEKSALSYICYHMKDSDLEELEAAGVDPRDVLLGDLNSDLSTMVYLNNEPCAVFGLRFDGLLSNSGIPWMLSTGLAIEDKKLFLQVSRRVINEMKLIRPNLYNHVYHKNIATIRWLEKLGFTIEPCHNHPITGELFRKFWIGELNV